MVQVETLDTGDYVTIAVYFALVLAVGLWVRVVAAVVDGVGFCWSRCCWLW